MRKQAKLPLPIAPPKIKPRDQVWAGRRLSNYGAAKRLRKAFRHIRITYHRELCIPNPEFTPITNALWDINRAYIEIAGRNLFGDTVQW